MGRSIALWLGVVTACYSPPHPECGFVCGTSGQCPTDYTCSGTDNICHLNGTSPAMICAVDAFVGHEEPPPEGLGFRVVDNFPANGAVMASRTQDILVRFDRSASLATITDTSFVVKQDGTTAVPGTISYVDATLTAHFTPSPPMPTTATIVVRMTSDILSFAGEPLAPYTFSFTTIDDVAPTVVSTNPLDAAMGVPITSVITVTFSEPVLNISATTFAVTQAANMVAGTLTSTDGITFTMTPTANLPAGSVVSVMLSAGITDLAGNPLAPVGFSFTTQ